MIFSMKRLTSMMAVLLALATLLGCLAACNPALPGEESGSSESPSGTPSGSETPIETPVETPPESTGESGSIGTPEETYPGDAPKETPPENPETLLYSKTQEKYIKNGNPVNIGCKSVTVLSQYTVGLEYDVKAVKNSTEKVFYLCLPSRTDLSSVTFTVQHYDGTVSGPYTADFSDDEVTDNERAIGNTSTYALKAMKSDRPSLMLIVDEQYGTIEDMNESGSHKVYTYGDMVITMPEETAKKYGWTTRYESVDEDPNMYCSMEMRGRGNATWGYAKKGYQFELESNMDLLGLGRSDTFVILANYNDASLMRNQIGLWLGQELGADFTSNYCQVDVFMNDEYLGMYMLTEKCDIGANRIEIDRNEDCLYEVNQKYQEYGEFGFLSNYDSLGKIRVHSAPNDDPSIAETYFRRADAAAYGNNEDIFLQYFDLESWAKAYIIQQFTMNHDAYWGSFYFYYDATDGKLHACTPWDFDYSMGISWASKSSKLNVENPKKFDIKGNYLIEGMVKFDSFKRAVVEVYYSQGGREIIAKMPEMIEYWTEENRLGAEMNHAGAPVRWYPDTEYTNYTKDVVDYDSAVEYLKWIVEPRVVWFAEQMAKWYEDVGGLPASFEGSGTEADPYLINNASDFSSLAMAIKAGNDYADCYFLQTADFNVSGISPALGLKHTFAGVYNGNGHTVTVKMEDSDGCLFPDVTGAVMNLVVKGEINNSLSASGIARAVSKGGKIINCVSLIQLNAGSTSGVAMNVTEGASVLGCVFFGSMTDALNKNAVAKSSTADAVIKYCFSKKISRLSVDENECTLTNDASEIVAAHNKNLSAIAKDSGVAKSKLCEMKLEDGELTLVPIK